MLGVSRNLLQTQVEIEFDGAALVFYLTATM